MLANTTHRMPLLGLLAAIVAGWAIAPTPASAAAQRYASPTGSQAACSSAMPCTLTEAVTGASGGDEVIVRPGDYPLTSTLKDPATITIHGVAGQPRPRLVFSGFVAQGLWLQNGSTLRYAEIRQEVPGEEALYANQASVDQVIARAAGTTWPTAIVSNSAIANSIFVATGADGRAVDVVANSNDTSFLRNITAVAPGAGGVAIAATGYDAGTNVLIHAVNVIARGGPGGADLRAEGPYNEANVTIAAYNSNYAIATGLGSNASVTPAGTAGNQTAAPKFVNADYGDFHQAAGSPTIEAGIDAPLNGTNDVDGDARVVGKTDIGADEYIAPPPSGGTTPPPDGSGAPATTTTSSASRFAGVTLVSRRLRFDGRFVTLALSCPAGTPGGCSGRTRLTARRRRAGSTTVSKLRLGRASLALAAGKRARIKVRVSRAGRKFLRRPRRHRATATISARNGAGQAHRTVAGVTIIRRHRSG